MSKRFTAKERAAIYLEAARREHKGFKLSINYFVEKTVHLTSDYFEFFPELKLLNGKVSAIKFPPDVQRLRVLSLLFAYQIALNP